MNVSGRFINSVLFILAIVLSACGVYAQTYLFQDPGLPDDARLDNLISLMTLEEKIDNLSPMLPGVPRLGVRGTRIVEGLHGLAWSGPANWAVTEGLSCWRPMRTWEEIFDGDEQRNVTGKTLSSPRP